MKLKFTISILIILLCAISCTYTAGDSLQNFTPNMVKAQAKSSKLLALKWEKQKMTDSAFYYYDTSCKLYLKANDRASAAYILLEMAEIQFMEGDYPGSIQSAMKSLSLYKDSPDKNYLLKAYKQLGASHKEIANYGKSLMYYSRATSLENDVTELLRIKSLIARLYIAQKKYTTAINLLDDIEKTASLVKNQNVKAGVLDRTGYAHFKINKSEGLTLMNKALEIRLMNNFTDDIILSYLHLTEFYSTIDIELAKKNALSAYKFSKTSTNSRRKLQSLLFLLTMTTGEDAKKYSQEYAMIKNEELKKLKDAETKFEKILHDTSSKNKINERTEKLEISKDNNRILILALAASVFSSILLFYQLTQRHKKERLLDAYAAETRLSKKIHDEIANELYGTLNYIEHEDVVSGYKKEKLIEQLDNIYLMTRNISRENNEIDTGLRFPVQLKLMLSAYANDHVNVIAKGISKVSWDKIESTKKIATYRVLQELMVNMSKHSRATVVLIDVGIDKNKIKIVYSDNGIGAACPKLNLKNGLQNVENRMVSIGGSISFDDKPEKGFHLTLTYPLPILYV